MACCLYYFLFSLSSFNSFLLSQYLFSLGSFFPAPSLWLLIFSFLTGLYLSFNFLKPFRNVNHLVLSLWLFFPSKFYCKWNHFVKLRINILNSVVLVCLSKAVIYKFYFNIQGGNITSKIFLTLHFPVQTWNN